MTSGRIALVSGKPDSGKTAYLQAVVQRAQRMGKNAGGVLSHGIWTDGRKTGFNLEIIPTGELYHLADEKRIWENAITYGRFFFDANVFKIAVEAIMAGSGSGLVVVDEFGPLEAAGGGLWPGIEYLLDHHDGCLVISVRPGLVAELMQRMQKFSNHP